MQQFLIRDLLMLTAMTAGGCIVVLIAEMGVPGFLLGACTTLISAGLFQQILWTPNDVAAGFTQRFGRPLILGLILVGLAASMHRTLYPYPLDADASNTFEFTPGETVESTLALPLWWFCLFLGSLTAARRAPAAPETQSKWRRRLRWAVNAAVAVGLIGYIAYLASTWATITVLVDIAICGIKVGMHQGPAVGTEHYVAWFGRTPRELHEFIHRQFWSWWPLIGALLLAVLSASRSPVSSRRVSVLPVFLVAILALPAVFNLAWMIDGHAENLFPEYVTSFWNEPRYDLSLAPLAIVLLSIYLTTRGGHHAIDGQQETISVRYWIDGRLTSLSFALAAFAFVLYDFQSTVRETLEWYLTESGFWETVYISCYVVCELTISYPEYAWSVFLAFYSVGLVWRSWKAPGESTTRWPRVEGRHLTWLPIVMALLALAITLTLPYGIAAFYAFA